MVIHYLKNNKKQIIFGLVIFLLIHMMKITNDYPNWDSVYGMKTTIVDGNSSGRWFSGFSLIVLSSPYELPWVRGIISAVFATLTASLLIDIFHIRNQLYQFTTIVLFAAFPSIASTLTYYWSPSYMLALFLAVFGTCLCIRRSSKKSICMVILCFTFSLGIYQIYFLIAIIIFFYHIGNELLVCETALDDVKRKSIRFFISIISGGGLYWCINKFLMEIFNYQLGTYQGMSDMGIMSVSDYVLAIEKMIKRVFEFFFESKKITFYGILNIMIAFVVLLFLLYILIDKKYSILRRAMICTMFLSTLPITYGFYFLTRDVYYHTVMETGNYFIYFFIILILDKYNIVDCLKRVVSIILLVLCFYHFINDNIAYYQLKISVDKTKFSVMETLIKIDQLEMQNINKMVVIGGLPPDKYSIVACPSIMGASSHNFVLSQDHFLQLARYYYGREYYGCTEEEMAKIKRNKEVKSMPVYPTGDYVKIIDEMIVVKLSE